MLRTPGVIPSTTQIEKNYLESPVVPSVWVEAVMWVKERAS
jgi:hypothetical protein